MQYVYVLYGDTSKSPYIIINVLYTTYVITIWLIVLSYVI